MTKVNDGQISIKASAWPSFMYDVDMFEEGCIEKGLCRGYFLVRVRISFSFQSVSLKFSRFSGTSFPDPRQLFQRPPGLRNHQRLNYMVLPRSLGGQLLMQRFKCISCHLNIISPISARCRLVLCFVPSSNGNATMEISITTPSTRILSRCSNADQIICGLGKHSRGGISMCEPLFGC